MSRACTALRRTAPFVLVGAVAVGLIAWMPAQVPGGRQRGERPAPQAGAPANLEETMDSMGGALKGLLKGINAENKDKSLELLARLQGGVVTAKVLVPPMAAKIEAAKRPEFVAGYRRLLVELLATTCKVETAILDGKYDVANELVAKDLTRIKGQGHDAYQEEEEEEGGEKGEGKK